MCNPNYQDLFLKMKGFKIFLKNIYQMGLNGRKKMEKEFDEKIVILNYINAINSYSKMRFNMIILLLN